MRSIRSLLFLAAATLLLAACARDSQTALPSAVREDLAKLPQDLQTVFYADVRSLLNSELGKEFQKQFNGGLQMHSTGEEYKRFIEATGFDPREDLHSVLIGMQAHVDAAADTARPEPFHSDLQGTAFAILKGNFDESKIVSHIQAKERETGKQELVVATYNGNTIYTGRRGKYAAYFAEANTLIVGAPDWVKALIDNKLDGENLPANAALMQLIDQLPYRHQLWAVGMPSDLTQRLATELSKHADFRGGHALRTLQSGQLAARVETVANLRAAARCDSEEDSQLMADALKGVLAMAKLAVSDDREFVDMLNRFEIAAKGREVHLAAKIDRAFLDKMKDKRAARKVATL